VQKVYTSLATKNRPYDMSKTSSKWRLIYLKILKLPVTLRA